MNNLIDKILEYKDSLKQTQKTTNTHDIPRNEFTLLLGGMSSFRKVPGISAHMGFKELYHCESEEQASQVKEHLMKLYGIRDFDSLMGVCYSSFATSGEYEQFMTFWKDAPLFDINQLEPQGLEAFNKCKHAAGAFYPLLWEKGFYAYDISERITLCRIAAACGLISEEQFYDVADEWVRIALVFYSSFEEYAISCICGAIYDMARYGDNDLEQYLDLNMHLADLLLQNNGPWQTCNWYQPENREWVDLVGHNLGCFVTKKALDHDYIGYMYHGEPSPEHPDSGWRFMYGDEDEEYLKDVNNTSIVALNTICNLHPDILAYIHADIDRSFYKDIMGWVEE